MVPVINFHNDLLGCVEGNEKKYDFNSREVMTSIPQMQEGGVRIETLAIGVLTLESSVQKAQRQLVLYQKLLKEHKEQVASLSNYSKETKKIHFLLALENASGLLISGESFDLAVKRLEAIRLVERILYISLTWNHENVFGGGNASKTGLKEAGKELLKYMHQKEIAIDFSHTSDALAYDILNFIDQNNLEIPFIVSHSNFRPIKDVPRNLPDELTKELIKRGAVIGLNFVRHFIGDNPEDFLEHIEHAFKLGAEDALVLGADFFGGFVVLENLSSKLQLPMFQEGFADSSCYPKFIELLKTRFDEQVIRKITYENGLSYLEKLLKKSLS